MTRYQRVWEGAWPYVGGMIAAAIWFWVLGAPFPSPAGGLLGGALTATAVVVGFLATAKAVLLGVTGTEVFRTLRDAGFTGSLFRYLFEAVWFGIAFLVVSVFGFFLDHAPDPIAAWYPPLWVALGTTVVLLYARITQLLFMLLSKA